MFCFSFCYLLLNIFTFMLYYCFYCSYSSYLSMHAVKIPFIWHWKFIHPPKKTFLLQKPFFWKLNLFFTKSSWQPVGVECCKWHSLEKMTIFPFIFLSIWTWCCKIEMPLVKCLSLNSFCFQRFTPNIQIQDPCLDSGHPNWICTSKLIGAYKIKHTGLYKFIMFTNIHTLIYRFT